LSAAINGRPVDIPSLGSELERLNDAHVEITLKNDDVESRFHLSVEIASDEDLAGVEAEFKKLIRAGHLDIRAIEGFIQQGSAFPSALRYVDGVCEYLYGVLAKEGSGGTTLPHAQYRERFNRSNDVLSTYPRPLSSTIRALIALNFNQFREAAQLSPPSRVKKVAERYAQWIERAAEVADPKVSGVKDHIDSFLTDRDTEDVLVRSMLPMSKLLLEIPNIEASVKREMPELDRAKVQILAAEVLMAAGERGRAALYARELRSTHAFGAWARGLLDAAGSGEAPA
jgi:hypothetical protein